MTELDRWVELVKECKYLSEKDLKKLCEMASDILIEEPNLKPVDSPATICGDIHGQFYDLEQLFRIGGQVPEVKYVFLGDYVDRGYFSLESFTRLLTLKVRYPDRITLLRGNHESRHITKVYGFYDECISKYGNANCWKYCCDIFDLLPVGALIDGNVLCVHGGLSPELRTLDDVNTIERNCEIPFSGPLCDVMWSDPEDIENWGKSPRGAGWLFGRKVTKDFMDLNRLTLICRAHQLVDEGIRYDFNDTVITVWSAPNYCYRCGNVAAILSYEGESKKPEPKIFTAVPDEEREIPAGRVVPYFL